MANQKSIYSKDCFWWQIYRQQIYHYNFVVHYKKEYLGGK